MGFGGRGLRFGVPGGLGRGSGTPQRGLEARAGNMSGVLGVKIHHFPYRSRPRYVAMSASLWPPSPLPWGLFPAPLQPSSPPGLPPQPAAEKAGRADSAAPGSLWACSVAGTRSAPAGRVLLPPGRRRRLQPRPPRPGPAHLRGRSHPPSGVERAPTEPSREQRRGWLKGRGGGSEDLRAACGSLESKAQLSSGAGLRRRRGRGGAGWGGLRA